MYIYCGKKVLICFLLSIGLLMISCNRQKTPSEANVKKTPAFKIGYMICNSEKETLDRFLPLTKYLGDKLGVGFEAVAIDTINFSNEVDSLHFTHTNSLLYIMMKRFQGVEVLSVERRGSLGDRSKGIIAVKKSSGIKSIAELKGKTMLFGPMLAPTGFMSQFDLLLNGGIDPDKDLIRYDIPRGSFKHEKVIYGVLFEKYDAGAFPFNDFESMSEDGRIDPDDFSILAEGPEIPYCNFAVTQKVDESFAQKFKKTLLDITENDTVDFNGEKVKVLSRALIDGFAEIKDSDFDTLREMAKRTNMPPYQVY